jgi:hypothetical protein
MTQAVHALKADGQRDENTRDHERHSHLPPKVGTATIGPCTSLPWSPSALTWAGSTLLLDAWWRHRQPIDLVERLRPFRFDLVADEQQSWLDDQH